MDGRREFAIYLTIVTFADSYLASWNKHVLSVNTIRELVIFSSVSYLYMCTGIYTLQHVLAVALASLP